MEARANDQSMRAFIEMVERRYPEDIIRIKEKVSPRHRDDLDGLRI